MIDRKDICAVVITHFPGTETVENLRAIRDQVSELLVIDNGSGVETLEPIRAAAKAIDATVWQSHVNRGIGSALNFGLRFARERGYRWLATFDQDSRATPTMLACLGAILSEYPGASRIGVLTPIHRDANLGITVGYPDPGAISSRWRVVPSAMTSGNLVNIQAATVVGGYDETLFIDYVDHEFCLRLRRSGYQVLEVRDAALTHRLGNMECHRVGRKHVVFTNHSPLRRYYITRNRLILWRGYWRTDRNWVCQDVKRFCIECIVVVLYENQPFAKLGMLARGILDGLRGIRGPFISGS